MKPPSFSDFIRTTVCLGTLVAVFTSTDASAALRRYRASWASEVNSATATAIIEIDNSIPIPEEPTFVQPTDPNCLIKSITMTVEGASQGNGTFTLDDFNDTRIGAPFPLDRNVAWYGQGAVDEQWGINVGDFTLIAPFGSEAPTATGSRFTLRTKRGSGDVIFLTEFTPLFDVLAVGNSLVNLPDTTIASFSPGELSSTGEIYARAKVKGTGIGSTNDACLLVWNGVSSKVLARENDPVSDVTISAFGDPVTEGATVYFPTIFRRTSTVINTNDQALVAVNTDGTDLRIIAREGDIAPALVNYTFQSFIWMHPLTNGVFFGATTVNIGDPKLKRTGVWFTTGFTTTLVTGTGESVSFGETNRVIKSITKPVASGAVAGQTRVGNANAINLLIKTTDGGIFLRPFPTP